MSLRRSDPSRRECVASQANGLPVSSGARPAASLNSGSARTVKPGIELKQSCSGVELAEERVVVDTFYESIL